MRKIFVTFIVLLSLSFSACGGGGPSMPTAPTPVATPTPAPAPTPQTLSIQAPTAFTDSRVLKVGQTAKLRANIEMSDGSVRENVSAEWTSSNTTVATVSDNGLVTARKPGGFNLRVTAEGLTARISGLRVVPKPTPWRRSGTGATILDLPTRITRIRIEGKYNGRGENFVVWCGISSDRGGLLVNEILGTSYQTRYSGIHSALRSYGGQGNPCRELQVEHSQGVRWTITETSPRSGLSLAVSTGSASADQEAVERSRAQIMRVR